MGRRRPLRGIAALAGHASPIAHRRLLAVAVVAVALGSLVPIGSAGAAEKAKLTIGFAPYRLGVNSAFTFAIQVSSTTGAVPSPATSMGLRMPASMGLSTSQLGLSVCRPEALRAGGVAGCPPEAVIGKGKASVVEASGSEQFEIPTAITVVMAPSVHEQTRLFFYAEGQSVMITELFFGGYMTGITKPLGTLVDATIPATVGVPGTPPAALTDMAVTLAPRGLMYVKHVNGRTVRYHPKGLAVPTVCPPGGFTFAVQLGFADGTYTEATTRLACPGPAGHGRARGHRRATGQGGRGK
jgi:hypothetical protein